MTRDPHTPSALARLDVLAAALSHRREVVAVLALGSAGTERHRFDEHSDLDVFVVVDDGCVDAFVDEQAWLDPLGPRAYSFRNERNGRKVLLADGLFVEYAVFTVDGLARLSFTGARTLWARADAPADLATCGTPPPAAPQGTVAFHLGEALTNLLVGLHRELRGERLTASRFIQSYAVDRLVSLLALSGPAPTGGDPFDRTRRVEQAWPPDVLPLADLVPGYRHNVAAASAALAWLRARHDVDPAVGGAIDALVATARRSSA